MRYRPDFTRGRPDDRGRPLSDVIMDNLSQTLLPGFDSDLGANGLPIQAAPYRLRLCQRPQRPFGHGEAGEVGTRLGRKVRQQAVGGLKAIAAFR